MIKDKKNESVFTNKNTDNLVERDLSFLVKRAEIFLIKGSVADREKKADDILRRERFLMCGEYENNILDQTIVSCSPDHKFFNLYGNFSKLKTLVNKNNILPDNYVPETFTKEHGINGVFDLSTKKKPKSKL